MPARVSKTFPKDLMAHQHREHRSKKGRRRFRDLKSANFSHKKKKDEDKISKMDLPAIDLDGLFSDPAEMQASYRYIKKNEPPKKARPVYLICENCLAKILLHFDPAEQDGYILLGDVICDKCGKPAFWSHYYDYKFIRLFYSATFCFLRDLIKAGKAKLTDFWV
jgi:hypothetical protein